ncbi:MAG: carbon-nitrogen hydrolase family protein [Gammaproteobacteria bacterium]|nr:carbon-nitrogen hydrolase family protein [Gammaproteobacteria bacterium]
MIDTFCLATVQAPFVAGAVSDNLDRMEAEIERAVANAPEAQLVLLPELAVTGFLLDQRLGEVAQLVDGEHYRRMAKLASALHLHLAYGYVERGADGSLYDSLILLDDRGEICGNYRKIHLTNREQDYFKPGEKIVSASTRLGRIGLMICWDLAFPELSRKLALDGCKLLLAPCAWERPYEQALSRFACARAIDNGVYLALSNSNGQGANLTFFGQSALLDPTGEAIAILGDQDGAVCAEVDYRRQTGLRREFYSMLDELRSDLY